MEGPYTVPDIEGIPSSSILLELDSTELLELLYVGWMPYAVDDIGGIQSSGS